MATENPDALSSLIKAIPPSSAPRAAVDWSAVESRLGFSLPADYKQLIDVYDEGCFDEFLWILHPTTANLNLNFQHQLSVRRAALADLSSRGGPDPDRAVPWAFTDNGDVCYWLIERDTGGVSESTIAVNESRGSMWSNYEMSTVEWLIGVLTGTIRVPMFPDDFPSPHPTFESA